jgi:hypothetical protein
VLLGISYLDRKTNDFVRSEVHQHVGYQEPLLATIKRHILAWFGHVTRPNTIMQETVECGRKRERQKKNWQDNVKLVGGTWSSG